MGHCLDMQAESQPCSHHQRANGYDGGVEEAALAGGFRIHPGPSYLLLCRLCQVSQAGRHIHQALLESGH